MPLWREAQLGSSRGTACRARATDAHETIPAKLSLLFYPLPRFHAKQRSQVAQAILPVPTPIEGAAKPLSRRPNLDVVAVRFGLTPLPAPCRTNAASL